LKITRYTQADCIQLLDDKDFWAADRLPVSRTRILSYVNNPRLQGDDILLYTAEREGKLVAYIAVLPDFMRAGRNGETIPFGWPSTWWADRDAALGPAASLLLFRALADWKGAIALSGFSTEAKEVFLASRRFKDLKVYDYTAFAIYLPGKFKGMRYPAGPINALLRQKNRRYANRPARKGLSWELVDSIDETTDRFITEQTRDDLFPRDGALFGWLIKYPWVTETTAEDRQPGSEMERYFFMCRADRFRQLPYKISRDGELIGFIFFTLRDDFLIVKYAIFPDDELEAIKECVQAITIEVAPHFLWSADDRLTGALEGDRMFYLASKHFDNPFYIGKQLEYDESARLHYGLGDRVMT